MEWVYNIGFPPLVFLLSINLLTALKGERLTGGVFL